MGSNITHWWSDTPYLMWAHYLRQMLVMMLACMHECIRRAYGWHTEGKRRFWAAHAKGLGAAKCQCDGTAWIDSMKLGPSRRAKARRTNWVGFMTRLAHSNILVSYIKAPIINTGSAPFRDRQRDEAHLWPHLSWDREDGKGHHGRPIYQVYIKYHIF